MSKKVTPVEKGCSRKCTPAPIKRTDYIAKIMDHGKKRNINIKSRVPAVGAPVVKLKRTQSARERPAPPPSSTFSITALVESMAKTKISQEAKAKEVTETKATSLDVGLAPTEQPFQLPVPLGQNRLQALIGRSSSFKETKTKSSSSNVLNFDVVAAAARFSARLRQEREERKANEKELKKVEEMTRLRLKEFPTVKLQNSWPGSTYIPTQWNWLRSLETALSDQKTSTFWEFHKRVLCASALLTQIRTDFEYGLNSDVEYVSCVCQDMTLVAVGQRSRNKLSINMIPYVRDIFKAEVSKQKQYSNYLTKPLRSPEDIKARTRIVQWFMQVRRDTDYFPETVHLAVFILDAYSAGNTMKQCSWTLLAIAVIYIASKMEETTHLDIAELLYYTRKTLDSQTFTIKDVIEMEAMILSKLRFDLHPPSAPFLASLVIYGGSLKFTTVHLRKLALDLTLGILYKTLINYELSLIKPVDKARAALEVAVELIYHQYNIWGNKDMSNYAPATVTAPGKVIGDIALEMCTQVFTQRLAKKDNKLNTSTCSQSIACNSPGRDLKV